MSNKIPHAACFAVLALATCSAASATVQVFFVGGQSNATAQYSAGISASLSASGLYDEVAIVHINHSGAGIASWVDNAGDNFYDTDFFNDAGSAALQAKFSSLTSEGKSYTFGGLFWFQGESDRYNPSGWRDRFLGAMASLGADIGSTDWNYVVTAIDIDQSFSPTPADVQAVDNLRAVMSSMVATDPRAILSDSRGYTRTDAYHLSAAEAYRFGEDSGDAFVAAAIPEPASFAALAGMVGIAAHLQRRRRA
jgi:hypothetical protein